VERGVGGRYDEEWERYYWEGWGLPEERQVGNAVTAAVAASRWLMGLD